MWPLCVAASVSASASASSRPRYQPWERRLGVDICVDMDPGCGPDGGGAGGRDCDEKVEGGDPARLAQMAR